MTIKIVVLDRDTLVKRPFNLPFPHTLIEYPHTFPNETAARITGAEIIISNKVAITAEHITANPQLKLIAVAATGYNNIDLAVARSMGVSVCNIQAYGNESVAEHAFMLMITLMRNLPAYQRDVAAGVWQQSPFFCHFGAPIHDLNGKTLAIFGRGNIGQKLAQYAQAFNMNILFAEHKHATSIRTGYVPFEQALSQADVLSLHCPLTDKTRHMIGETELQMMKPQAVLINCGRGGLVDEFALIAALKYGTLGGAGFDVLSEEPPTNSNPLLKTRLPNLIVTPHIAWSSLEAQNKLFDILNNNICAFIAGKAQNVVV